jgi:hypothetical protein
MIPPSFADALAQALKASEPLTALRTLAAAELAKGTQREVLVDWFEAARARFPEQEDVLLEVLDFVVGWCSPHMKLAGTLPGAGEGAVTPGAGFPGVPGEQPLDAGKRD